LAVISRSSVEQYRDRANRPPLRQIANELGADYLVEGSARIGGDSVRITVQLIEGDTDLHLWSADTTSGAIAGSVPAMASSIAPVRI